MSESQKKTNPVLVFFAVRVNLGENCLVQEILLFKSFNAYMDRAYGFNFNAYMGDSNCSNKYSTRTWVIEITQIDIQRVHGYLKL